MFSFGCLQAMQLNRFSDELKKPGQSSTTPSVRHTGTACPRLLFAVLGHAPVDSHLLLGCCSLILVWAKKLNIRGKRLQESAVLYEMFFFFLSNSAEHVFCSHFL